MWKHLLVTLFGAGPLEFDAVTALAAVCRKTFRVSKLGLTTTGAVNSVLGARQIPTFYGIPKMSWKINLIKSPNGMRLVALICYVARLFGI